MECKYLDSEGKELSKGFYGILGNENYLVYFTGKYDEENRRPIFNTQGDLNDFNETWVKELKLRKFENREIKNLVKKKKDRIDEWIENQKNQIS